MSTASTPLSATLRAQIARAWASGIPNSTREQLQYVEDCLRRGRFTTTVDIPSYRSTRVEVRVPLSRTLRREIELAVTARHAVLDAEMLVNRGRPGGGRA